MTERQKPYDYLKLEDDINLLCTRYGGEYPESEYETQCLASFIMIPDE